MSERESELVPVKEFSELRVGIRVVLKSCKECGRTHRGMIIKGPMVAWCYPESEAAGPDLEEDTGFDIVPVPSCFRRPAMWFLTVLPIEEGRLFRRVDLVEDETPLKVNKRKPARVE